MHAVSIKACKTHGFYCSAKQKQKIIAMAVIIHFAAALCLIHLSTGQECRNVASVINSAKDLQTNVNAGGHIWQHIDKLGTKPIGAATNDTQNGKNFVQ